MHKRINKMAFIFIESQHEKICLSLRGIKAQERPFQSKPHLKLLSVHWSEGGFSQAAWIDDLDSQKAGEKRKKEGRLVQ